MRLRHFSQVGACVRLGATRGQSAPCVSRACCGSGRATAPPSPCSGRLLRARLYGVRSIPSRSTPCPGNPRPQGRGGRPSGTRGPLFEASACHGRCSGLISPFTQNQRPLHRVAQAAARSPAPRSQEVRARLARNPRRGARAPPAPAPHEVLEQRQDCPPGARAAAAGGSRRHAAIVQISRNAPVVIRSAGRGSCGHNPHVGLEHRVPPSR